MQPTWPQVATLKIEGGAGVVAGTTGTTAGSGMACVSDLPETEWDETDPFGREDDTGITHMRQVHF